jgi:tetratricopeptide (TPR) repeat protein
MKRIGSITHHLSRTQEAATMAEAALALARSSGSAWEIADAQRSLARVLRDTGDSQRSEQLLEDALTWSRSAGDFPGQAEALATLALLAGDRADFTRARPLTDEALTLYRAAGDDHGIVHSLFDLGYLALAESDGDRALPLFEEAIALCREMGSSLDIAAAGFTLGVVHADHLGDDTTAEPFYAESLALWQAEGNVDMAAGVLHDLGRLATRQRDFSRAEARHREALALRLQSADPVVATFGPVEAAVGMGEDARARGETVEAITHFQDGLQLLQAEISTDWDRGDLGQWVRLIAAECLRLAVCTVGDTVDAAGAARLLAAAEALRRSQSWGVLQAEQERHECDAALIRARLSASAFNEAWEAGHALSIEDAIDTALTLVTHPVSKGG